MKLEEKIVSLVSEIEQLNRENPESKLPQNTYYLNDNEIVCFERECGESRFPYDSDGLVVWARSSGYIEAFESTFHIFKPILRTEDPSVSFFAGIDGENGRFTPISVLGITRQLGEPEKTVRYVVYAPCCAYYITVVDDLIFAVRLHTDLNKHIHFSYIGINQGNTSRSLYMSSLMEAILRFRESEHFWDRMTKFGRREGNSCILWSSNDTDDCLVINRAISEGDIVKEYHTVGKSDVLGSGRMISNAYAWEHGKFIKERNAVNTTDIPVLADLFHLHVKSGESIRIDYELSYYHDIKDAEKHMGNVVCPDVNDKALAAREKAKLKQLCGMSICFDGWKGRTNTQLFNRFLRNVQNQVSLCALGKNYVGSLIGVRDVMQQLESSLLWQPKESREKIVTAMNFILEDGRAPRCFSFPVNEQLPQLDLRQFIDQGNWIISTIYSYLAYTDDYSILEEECSYYVVDDKNTRVLSKSGCKDTVLDHMVRIMEFLASNIDKKTQCLRALCGDWNDAVNGLGKNNDSACEFGSGVSVMASLHFYQNCREMKEILGHIRKYPEKIGKYEVLREGLEKGLAKYALVTSYGGERRIIHGWGDKLSYKLASFCDSDGVSRISSTSHSFWAISGMLANNPSLKETIITAFHSLQSKYGLKTFDIPFPRSMRDEAGRICDITPGTYENSAAYVHAAMFASMALFCIGESEWAWKEIENSIVITHENCSMTPFVMPNSYCDSEEWCMNGESMGDWYTGSGTVLIKEIVKYGFGVAPDLEGLWIQTAKVLPCNSATLKISVKGHPITIEYINEGCGHRSFVVDNNTIVGDYDTLIDTRKIYIKTEEIYDGMYIKIID